MSFVQGLVKFLNVALDLSQLVKTNGVRLQVVLKDAVRRADCLTARIREIPAVMGVVVAKDTVLTGLLDKSLLIVGRLDKVTPLQTCVAEGNERTQGLLFTCSLLLDGFDSLHHLLLLSTRGVGQALLINNVLNSGDLLNGQRLLRGGIIDQKELDLFDLRSKAHTTASLGLGRLILLLQVARHFNEASLARFLLLADFDNFRQVSLATKLFRAFFDRWKERLLGQDNHIVVGRGSSLIVSSGLNTLSVLVRDKRGLRVEGLSLVDEIG